MTLPSIEQFFVLLCMIALFALMVVWFRESEACKKHTTKLGKVREFISGGWNIRDDYDKEEE